MGADTACSQVSASAPGYVAASWISGGAMLGYSEIGRDSIDTIPTSVMRIAMTMATIGRLMKKRDIARSSLPGRGRGRGPLRGLADVWLGVHLHAAANLLQALGHHPLTGLDPVGDHPERFVAGTHLDAADVDRVVGPDGRQLIAPLDLLPGALRDDERALQALGHHLHACELSRAQEIVRIVEQGLDLNGAGLRLDLPVVRRRLPLARVQIAV